MNSPFTISKLAIQAQVISAVVGKAPAHAGDFTRPTAVAAGHEGLAVDEAAGRVLALLSGRGQAGLGVVFLAAGEQQRGQGEV